MPRPKKIQHFKIREFINGSGTKSWRVIGTKADGSRTRVNFSNKLEALQSMADLEAEYAGQADIQTAKRTRLSIEQLADAEAALAAAPHRTITRIVNHYLALEARAQAKGVNLDSALSFVEANYRAETRSITILNAYTEFVSSKSNTSDKTEIHYKSSLKHLLTPLPNRFVHEFTVHDIEKILNRYTNLNSRRTYRRAFSAFFNWAVRHHYCLENPCERLDKLPRDMSQISALSLDESKRLLYAAMKLQDGSTAATVAIGMFAGLRPSEIRDLKPEDILNDRIRVAGGKLRRKLKRTVPIPPVLDAWLREYAFTGLPPGWDGKLKKLKEAVAAKKWVQDIVRHTSITFQTERDKNESLTAFNCGTSIEMMNRHYRDIVDDAKMIEEFWSLTPAKLLENPPKIKLPDQKRVSWPDKKTLTKWVWSKPLMHVAKDIGVSDVALKKHCVKLGIELPRQGYWLKK